MPEVLRAGLVRSRTGEQEKRHLQATLVAIEQGELSSAGSAVLEQDTVTTCRVPGIGQRPQSVSSWER